MVKLIKPALLLVGVILISSLIGIGAGGFIPAEKTSKVTLANYSHRGEFSYTGYSASSLFSGESAQPAPVLFPQLIEEMAILFAYSDSAKREVEIKVILEDKSGNWWKEIPIQTSGGSIVSFPLDLDQILGVGDAINEQLGERDYGYLLKIVAEVGSGSDPFTAVLEGELDSSALKWKEAGFTQIERGFPGGDDWRQGAFGYKVKLKENVLFGPVLLERKPDLPLMVVVSSDFPLFTDLVESVDIGFDYQFNSDTEINSLTEEVKVEMVLMEPERWRKTFILVPPTEKQGEFNLNIPLDIGKLREMAETIDAEIGGRVGREQEITISVQVHTIAETDYGTIDEVLNYQLKGKMGEKIEWGAVEGGAKGLLLIEEGAITKEITEPNLVSQRLRTSSLITLGLSLPIFCGVAVLYWRRRPKSSFLDKELKRNRKKYGALISEVTDLPSITEKEVIIPASSLAALANISNNSLKPILLKVEPDKHSYCVIDGLVKYEYISELNSTTHWDQFRESVTESIRTELEKLSDQSHIGEDEQSDRP